VKGAAELLEAIEAGDERKGLTLLRERPELATARHESGLSALMLALYHGQGELAAALAAAAPELDVFEAAAVGDAERLRTLLDESPELVSAWSLDGFTPLHLAAFFGRLDATRLLVERGADLEAPARNEEFALQARPLHSAAAAGRRDVCAVLLEAGADPNTRQHGGYTPYLEAVQQGDSELADLLLGKGAEASARLDDGRGRAELAPPTDTGK